jgi:hypothetical protein
MSRATTISQLTERKIYHQDLPFLDSGRVCVIAPSFKHIQASLGLSMDAQSPLTPYKTLLWRIAGSTQIKLDIYLRSFSNVCPCVPENPVYREGFTVLGYEKLTTHINQAILDILLFLSYFSICIQNLIGK